MQEINLNGQSHDIVKENVAKLKHLFPEIVTEDNIDFDKLKAVLGDYIENDDESYRFTWYGKRDAFRKSQIPSTGTLRPCIEESKDWDTTQNLYIEGDNLEVLKLLQKSYNNRIKMIYIDPPYNKDKDFIYPDKWSDPIKEYKRITGQIDDEGNITNSDVEDNGGRHTKWLNMMYPRLRLAKNLLADEGVLLISIDDEEVENLKKICNEIMGEENYVAQIVIASNSSKNNSKFVSISHDYILCYVKDKTNQLYEWKVKKNNADEFEKRAKQLIDANLSFDEIHDELLKLTKYPRFYDFDHYTYADEQGVFRTDNAGGVTNGNFVTEIIHPVTGKKCAKPNGGWRYKDEEIKRLLIENMFYFGVDETIIPTPKRYLKDYIYQVPKSLMFFDSQSSTKWLQSNNLPFDFPKAVELIKHIVSIFDNDSLILDFFSGSATTAHAVMQINAEDEGKRKFILIQLPEAIDEKSDAYKAGYINIAEIGKERIRLAGDSIKAELKAKYDKFQQKQQSVLDEKEQEPMNPEDLDIGFKVFKLDNSNLKKWSVDVGEDFYKESKEEKNAILSEMLGLEVDNFVEDRSELDVVYEVMLKYGLDLTYPIETYDFDGTNIYSIGYGGLIVCLDTNIRAELADKIIELIKELEPSMVRVAVRDLSFESDSAKTNFKETLKNGVHAYFESSEDKADKQNQFKFITI